MGESWSDYLACGQRRTKEKTEEKNKSNGYFNKFTLVQYLMTITVHYVKKKKKKSYSVQSLVFFNGSVEQNEKRFDNRQWNILIKIHCFPLRIKKTVKRMRRRMRRNKNQSVGDPLWNLLFHQTHLAVYLKHLIVKVNQEPEVHGTTCQIPHHYQMEQKVHLVHSCSGMEVHVNSDVMRCISMTTSANTVLSAALKSYLTCQWTSNITKQIFNADFAL